MRLLLASLLSTLLLAASSEALVTPIVGVAQAPLAVKNGQTGELEKNSITALELDSGWFKFFFGQANEETAYTFAFHYDDYVQISLTDAYCPGDSFDLYKDNKYLLTTPRVSSDGCKNWTDDPQIAFKDDTFSSTKFMLPGKFNLTLWSKDSPYKGGAAFIRADSRLQKCQPANSPFILVTAPLSRQDQVAAVCKRVGGTPAHLEPKNTAAAAKMLGECGYQEAWFGRLSLLPRTKSKDLGCLAFTIEIPDDPTVDVVDCKTKLPVLCHI